MVRKNRQARVKRPRRPRVVRGWIAANQRAVWYAAAGTLAAILYAIAAPVEAAVYGAPVLVALFVTAARCAALVVAVRWPVVGVIVFTISSAVVRFEVAPPGAPWPWSVTAIVEFTALVFAVWSLHGWRRGLVAYLVPGARHQRDGTARLRRRIDGGRHRRALRRRRRGRRRHARSRSRARGRGPRQGATARPGRAGEAPRCRRTPAHRARAARRRRPRALAASRSRPHPRRTA